MHQSNWQKSSFSSSSDNCVEVRTMDGLVGLRESDDGELILHTATSTFAGLLRTIKAGELDHYA
ncbi:DUF397 domain-containing protein [Kitasatospora purpeofusca]|uniref:DUF397 domain-containing protein n=1 Tax=Kitasatospora purpeofusca TaxID=67352 RepID=UPI002A5A91CC|nr:DUF397 domain-containing protein [Kitasatospora purpeofusca]MDY0810391.1 DUF397 domain-containing protein [Kitasatospora purpeofusca]